MRLFVQVFLITLFFGFSFSVSAQEGGYNSEQEALAACKVSESSGAWGYGYRCTKIPEGGFPGSSGWDGVFRPCLHGNPSSCYSANYYWIELQIPSCDPPNYIHPETNECTQPEEVCFTTIESMADRCVFIGETTPDAPPGCIRDEETQAEICLSENQGCYVADGKEICPTPGMVCGVKNGTFSCVAPEQEGCGYFNGERVCFTPDGDKVQPDSPDHPDNGGNLDGDDTNDPTDPRTPEEGGNPDKQPIDTTGQGDGATEGTAKEQLKALRKLRDEAVNQNKANTGNAAALEQGISSGIDSAGDAATAQLDQHIEGVNSGAPMSEDDLSGVEAKISNLFGVSTQCVDIVFGTDDLYYTITCQQMDKIRDFLGFILYGFTLIRLFQIVLRPAAQGTP